MGSPSCCCCFSGNVRHLILFLTTVCITLLYANVVLFGLTTVLHDEGDLSAGLRTVESTSSLHPSVDEDGMRRRLRRDVNETEVSAADVARVDGLKERPNVVSDPVTQIISVGDDFPEEEEGHPIVTHDLDDGNSSDVVTPSIPEATKKIQPKVIFFTNSPLTEATTIATTKGRVSRQSTVHGSTVAPTEEVKTLMGRVEDKDIEGGRDTKADPLRGIDKVQREPKNAGVLSLSLPITAYLTRSLIYAAPGLGVLAGTLPATVLIKSFGSRNVFTLAMLLSAAVTAGTPYLVAYGFIPLFALRFLVGLAFSVCLPLAGAVTANWGTLKEQLTFIAVIFLFVPWAPIFSWNLSMFLFSNDVKVQYIYVTHASLTLLFALFFFVFHRDKPQYHDWVNGIELNRIVAGKVQELKSNRILSNPLSTLLRSISAWAIWTAMFGFFAVITVFATFLPTFFSNMDVWLVDYIGLYGALPFLGMPLCYLLSGLSNRSVCCKSTTQVRIWNSISYLMTSIMLLVVPVVFMTQEEGTGRNLMLLFSLAPLGFVMAGALRSVTLVGRFYAQHILSYMGFAFGLAMTVMPFLVLFIVRTNNFTEWMRVFVCSAGVLAISGVAFAVFGRGRSAGWAEHSWDPLQTGKMRTIDPIDISHDECGIYEMRLIGPSSK